MIHSPPTRRSHSDSTTESGPPALSARWASGSVYASNTTLRGRLEPPLEADVGAYARRPRDSNVAVERVEPPFPHAKRLDPLPSSVEAFWAERALPDPAYLSVVSSRVSSRMRRVPGPWEGRSRRVVPALRHMAMRRHRAGQRGVAQGHDGQERGDTKWARRRDLRSRKQESSSDCAQR